MLAGMNYTLLSHVTPPCVIGLGACRCSSSGASRFLLPSVLGRPAYFHPVKLALHLPKPGNIRICPQPHGATLAQLRFGSVDLSLCDPRLQRLACDLHCIRCLLRCVRLRTHERSVSQALTPVKTFVT